ncbi:MAG: hypothetical protein V1808_00785 [Candidatus Daviesbacteria bacterium]
MATEKESNPIIVLQNAQEALQRESDYLNSKSEAYYRGEPTAVGADWEKHFPGAVNQRLAGVYSETAEQLSAILTQLKRNILRNVNPFFSNLSDEEADEILKQEEQEYLRIHSKEI